MRIYLLITISYIGLALFSCERKSNDFDIEGSWFYDSSSDSTYVDYTELYFNDSTFYPQTEGVGQWYHPRKYRLTKDSLYYFVDKNFVPYYKVLRFKDDTLYLMADRRTVPKKRLFMVRLPRNEKGHYDHIWTSTNIDSLNYIVRNDWHRRMIRYHLNLTNDLKKYDSLVNAGFWKFTEENILEERKR